MRSTQINKEENSVFSKRTVLNMIGIFTNAVSTLNYELFMALIANHEAEIRNKYKMRLKSLFCRLEENCNCENVTDSLLRNP